MGCQDLTSTCLCGWQILDQMVSTSIGSSSEQRHSFKSHLAHQDFLLTRRLQEVSVIYITLLRAYPPQQGSQMTSPGEVRSLTAEGGVSMGGIYSKEDTSFLIMCSSFLFPINIWDIFIGSQFSSAISHMVPQHRLIQAVKEHRETLLLESSGKPSPALSEAGQGVTNMRRNSRKKGI